MYMSTCIPPEIADALKESLLKGEIGTDEIIKMLPEERAVLEEVLKDFISDKLGVDVKEQEILEIEKLSKEIDAAAKKLGNDLGLPTKEKENIEFFKAKKEMDDYITSLVPTNKIKVLTGTIGRGMMLASVKSPILNIGSNIEIAITETLARRLASGQLRGADNDLALDFIKMANKIYQQTGYDISRMTNLKDTGESGERVLGQTVNAQGKGAIRKVGRVVEDIVFKQLMGAPDVAFGSAHFADSVNLAALKMAGGNKVLAREIMEDSMRLEPQTPEGDLVRNQGILDAQTATWTNKTWASRVSEGIRKILNDVSGNARIGDYLLPFVKTPANVIATGFDYAGAGIPKALIKSVQAFRSGQLGSKEHLQSISKDLVRSGLGLAGAFIIAAQLDDEDFVGAYDPARAQIEQLRNSNYNAIRIGDKWISTDWLGPLMVPVTAIMYSRKYGDTGGEKTYQYARGVAGAALEIPGVSDIYEEVKSKAYKKNQSLEEMTGSTVDYLTSEAYSRLIPSLSSDIAKALDPFVRQSGKGLQGVKAKIPGVSQSLPVKRDIFGEPIRGESAVSDILFGARVKTDKETALVKEISRVSDAVDKGITFTDWDKSSSKTLTQFKEKVGKAKFEQAKIRYGKELKKELEKVIKNPLYKSLSDEEKLKVLNDKDTDAMNAIFKEYGFKYKSATRSKAITNL